MIHWMAEPESRDKVANNTYFVLVARTFMALSLPAVGLVSWLFWQYLEAEFRAIDLKLDQQTQRAEGHSDRISRNTRAWSNNSSEFTSLQNQVNIMETIQDEREVSTNQFRATVIDRLDGMSVSLGKMSNQLSGLSAVINGTDGPSYFRHGGGSTESIEGSSQEDG